MDEMMEEYRRALEQLYARRRVLCGELGAYGRRLAVLDEEIDELEEALMYMRQYAAI